MPVAWDELGPELRSDTFTVADASKHFRRKSFRDPWENFFQVRQSLKRGGK
jgi:DNA primase